MQTRWVAYAKQLICICNSWVAYAIASLHMQKLGCICNAYAKVWVAYAIALGCICNAYAIVCFAYAIQVGCICNVDGLQRWKD